MRGSIAGDSVSGPRAHVQRLGGRKVLHTFKESKDRIMVHMNPVGTSIQGEVHSNERAQQAHIRGTERSHIFCGPYTCIDKHRHAHVHTHAEQYAVVHRAMGSGWPGRNKQMNRRRPREAPGVQTGVHTQILTRLPMCTQIQDERGP